MARILTSGEDVINEVRTAHKSIRRWYWRLQAIGLVVPNSLLAQAFMDFDSQLYQVERSLVEIYYNVRQETLFQLEEGTPESVPSLGGSSQDEP